MGVLAFIFALSSLAWSQPMDSGDPQLESLKRQLAAQTSPERPSTSTGEASAPGRTSAPERTSAPGETSAPENVPAPGETSAPQLLSLPEVLKLALSTTPSLERQLAVIQQRGSQVDEAYTQAYPTVNFQSQYQRVEPPVTFSNGTVINPPDNYNFALTIQQPLYTFGRLKFGTLAAELSRRAEQETYTNQLQEVILGGASLYIQALLTDEAVQIAEDELKAQQANLGVTKALSDQGVVARFDVLRTGAAASRAEQVLLEAHTAREVAYARLRSYANLAPRAPIDLAPLDLSEPPNISLDEAQPQILERRSDMKALRWAVEAAEARVRAANAEGSPTLSLQNQTVNRNATGFSPGTQNTTSLVFSIPLFDGGVSRSRAEQAEAVVRQLEADLEQRRRDVLLEAEEAYRQLTDRWASIEVARAEVEQAEEALRVAVLRYENGISTNLERLDAQATWARARFSQAQAQADYQQALWRWRRVSAGDFPVEVPNPPELGE